MRWFRKKSSVAAGVCAHTDTDEVCSSSIRRVANAVSLEDTKQFKAYASVVIKHAMIDHARRARSRQTINRSLMPHAGQGGGVAGTFDEEIKIMFEQMLMLDTGHRGLIELTARGMNSREIGELYSLPASTVRSRIASAKLIMKRGCQLGERS